MAPGNLGAGRDANLGVPGVYHAAVHHWHGDVVEACHGGILSDLSPMRKLALLVVVTACHGAAPPSTTSTPESPARGTARITSTDQLVDAMRDRYAGKWYRTLTFVQKTTFFRPDGTSRVETWYEAAAFPGRLRIDLDDPSRGNGVVYRGDSVYTL